MITTLIKQGANVNAQDIAGRTALHIAAMNNFIETIKILLYELADPFIKNNDGKMSIDMTSDIKCKFFLSKARIVRNSLIIKYILLSCMCYINLGGSENLKKELNMGLISSSMIMKRRSLI